MEAKGAEKVELTQDQVADMIAAALDKKDEEARQRETDSDRFEKTITDAYQKIDVYAPLVEAYGPRFIEKIGPTGCTLLLSFFKEMWPALSPIMRTEVALFSRIFWAEGFRQAKEFRNDQMEELPGMMGQLFDLMNKAMESDSPKTPA